MNFKECLRENFKEKLKRQFEEQTKMHFKVYFQDYFKEPLKNHLTDFNWNAFRGTFRSTQGSTLWKTSWSTKKIPSTSTKFLKYNFKEGPIREVLQRDFQWAMHGQLQILPISQGHISVIWIWETYENRYAPLYFPWHRMAAYEVARLLLILPVDFWQNSTPFFMQ